ncbi:MAG: hypothetical protein WBD65_12625, partial [Methylocella sp.]
FGECIGVIGGVRYDRREPIKQKIGLSISDFPSVSDIASNQHIKFLSRLTNSDDAILRPYGQTPKRRGIATSGKVTSRSH